MKDSSFSSCWSRREFVRRILYAGGCVPLGGLASSISLAESPLVFPAPPPQPGSLLPDDESLLDDLEKTTFQFFWEQASPVTGLVKDRCSVRTTDTGNVASIAATGFGLTALCIGEHRGYVPRLAAQERALTTLRCLWRRLPNHRGFFYHWANFNTGERVWDAEVSSVDTAILLCGVLACREHFGGAEIRAIANDVLARVEWTWLSEDTSLLPHGWTPEIGFLPYRWDNYSELMMMYLLGLGSESYPLKSGTWTAWKRLKFEYDGLRYIGSFAPLFVHQYSQAWFDFRGKRDAYADYFQNSVIATDVHRRFCMEWGKRFPSYRENLWGVTASDSPRGYVIWGGPPSTGPIDGTIVPSASAGSLPFLPGPVMRVLHAIKNGYPNAYTKYGFVNAFNPLTGWYDTDVIGIDTGITLLMAENARSGFVWQTFMKSKEAQRGMARAGFEQH